MLSANRFDTRGLARYRSLLSQTIIVTVTSLHERVFLL